MSPHAEGKGEGKAVQPSRAARAPRKVMTGIVVSDRMMKTVVVKVSRLVRHPMYPRVIRRSNTFKVHDESNSAKIGDWVKIMETRPLSKNKRWRLVEILRRATVPPPTPGLQQDEPDDLQSVEEPRAA